MLHTLFPLHENDTPGGNIPGVGIPRVEDDNDDPTTVDITGVPNINESDKDSDDEQRHSICNQSG